MEIWNPLTEHIEGKLCEKGLLKERYDKEKEDLIRTLTPFGRLTTENLLKEKENLKVYLELAQQEISKFPLEVQAQLWEKVIKSLKKI
ncbi:MAG TPA: hypothetical protein VGB37_01080 [Candidatus Lokiarchaeia archaeon]